MPSLSKSHVELFTFQRTKALQQYSGDMYFVTEKKGLFLCVLADGLGSGIEAHRSAKAVIETVKLNPEGELPDLMEQANQAVSGLRGAAVAMIRADLEHRKLTYTGTGNIRFYFVEPGGKVGFPLSTMGFLSGRKQLFKVKTFDFKSDSKFLIHSDGLVLKKARSFLTSPLDVIKTGHSIERQIASIPEDDVSFVLGKFPQ
ncbi:sigma-B negative effector [Listeria floridensis FSL S10-1187]|uniref:Sigma-B negative effector n=1 Tax=Listeria floridensis FSL S10-1187 TaxID=1265817 RepID=A0ABN0RE51_9LIST|nr:PP2C family serine/threonine-protein phosphatase [Listeria floridensis]EUJ30772.1 sigma-B negative effector [Listeria floridensis FSL S10-1187]